MNARPARPIAPSAALTVLAAAMATLTLLSACSTTETGTAKTAVSGAAGGANAEGANSTLEKCDQSLGTLSLVEDQTATWYQTLSQYKLGSTVPVLRIMIQQSNCFVIVERGAAMQNMNTERALQQSGEMRNNSNFGKGQMVAADFTMSPNITFSQGTGGAHAGALGFIPGAALLGAVAGGMKTSEASTTLIMIDNRSGVQLAAAEGSAKNRDFDIGLGMFGGLGAVGGGAYSSTPEGKIIIAAFTDSYNQLVKAVRNYKAQTVKGGLGTGGTLGVSGGATQASQDLNAAPAAAAASKPAVKKKPKPAKAPASAAAQ